MYGAAFYRNNDKTRCLLFKRSLSTVLLYDILPDGRFAVKDDSENDVVGPREAYLGESGWNQLRYVKVKSKTYLVGLKLSSGRVGVWSIDSDGLPVNSPGGSILTDSLELGHAVLGFTNTGNPPPTPQERLVFLREVQIASLPLKQNIDFINLKNDGKFVTHSGNPALFSAEIEGNWTDLIIISDQDPDIWLLIDRHHNEIFWVDIQASTGALTIRARWRVSGNSIWSKVAIRSDENRGLYLTAYDHLGILWQYTLNSPVLRSFEISSGLDSLGEISHPPVRYIIEEMDDGPQPNHTTFEMFEADDGFRLLLMKGGVIGYGEMWALTDNNLGNQLGEANPRIERIEPVTAQDRTKLGNSFLSSTDKKALDVLVKGNVEIRHAGQDRILDRIGVAFMNKRISDIAVFLMNGETLL